MGRNREVLEEIGVMTPEDECIPDSLTDPVFFAIWSSYLLISRTQRQEISQKIISESNIDAEVKPANIIETFKEICDESGITEEEILEMVEKRFAKALPLDCINIVVLMD
jgi:hypothetical protein